MIFMQPCTNTNQMCREKLSKYITERSILFTEFDIDDARRSSKLQNNLIRSFFFRVIAMKIYIMIDGIRFIS